MWPKTKWYKGSFKHIFQMEAIKYIKITFFGMLYNSTFLILPTIASYKSNIRGMLKIFLTRYIKKFLHEIPIIHKSVIQLKTWSSSKIMLKIMSTDSDHFFVIHCGKNSFSNFHNFPKLSLTLCIQPTSYKFFQIGSHI